jgi:hypothetical protein
MADVAMVASSFGLQGGFGQLYNLSGPCPIRRCAYLKDEPAQLIPTRRQRYGRDRWGTAKPALTAVAYAPMNRPATDGAQAYLRKEHTMRHGPIMRLSNLPATHTAHRKIYAGSRKSFAVAVFVSAVVACLLPSTASAGSTHGKRLLNRPLHDFGFLPGYEPPEVIAWERARARRPTFWYGGPGFYRGRWNGGGFGPCWTSTPIGPHWNCG